MQHLPSFLFKFKSNLLTKRAFLLKATFVMETLHLFSREQSCIICYSASKIVEIFHIF